MDIRKVKKLIELLEESGIDELEIREGEESVRISRHSKQPAFMQQPMYAPAPAPAAPAAAPVAAEAAAPVAAKVDTKVDNKINANYMTGANGIDFSSFALGVRHNF